MVSNTTGAVIYPIPIYDPDSKKYPACPPEQTKLSSLLPMRIAATAAFLWIFSITKRLPRRDQRCWPFEPGAPIVPMFMVRHEDQSHTLIIEPALPNPANNDKQAAIEEITQQFTTRIEKHIRATRPMVLDAETLADQTG